MAGPLKWNPYEFYDVTEQELAAVKERLEMRKQRKAEWQRKVTNPFKPAGYFIRDPQIDRMYALRLWSFAQWRATSPKSLGTLLFGLLLPVGGMFWFHQSHTIRREEKYRRGLVAYADRKNKLFH